VIIGQNPGWVNELRGSCRRIAGPRPPRVLVERCAADEPANTRRTVPGIDVVFVASTDLGSFSGLRQGAAKYEALVTRVLESTTKAGLKVGGPQAWKDTRKGYGFFQDRTRPACFAPRARRTRRATGGRGSAARGGAD